MTAQAGGASPPSQPTLTIERGTLRKQLRQQRQRLSKIQQHLASCQFAIQFDRWRLLKPGLRIAVYLSMPSELDLQAFITRARARRCHLYVPHIVNTRRRQMQFVALSADARLQRHRWGMTQLQRTSRHAIGIRQLDMVLVPTVAFDARGHRLGMGAGFYDRHFACLRNSRWQRPRLIGAAYALQQVKHIPALAHDLPLPWVMTERGLIRSQWA